MSKRKFVIILATSGNNVVKFSLNDAFNKFRNVTDMEDTELAYTLEDDVDFLLDLKENQVVHYYEDRAKEFPCLLKRIA